VDDEELPIEILKVDPVLEEKQKAKLKDLKKQRDKQAVTQTLKGVRQAAEADENLIPSLIEAVKVYATMGEMCDVLREVYGEHTAPSSY
jgi:methylmalonyl-CoA mutase N-terminal domain/subunit